MATRIGVEARTTKRIFFYSTTRLVEQNGAIRSEIASMVLNLVLAHPIQLLRFSPIYFG